MSRISLALLLIGCDANSDLKYNETSAEQENSNALPGALNVSHSQMDFEIEDFATTINDTLNVSSIGENALEISRIDITNSGNGIFYIEETEYVNLSLAPETSIDVLVIVSGLEEEPTAAIWGELRIRSNDEETSDLRIPLCAYPTGGSCQ